LTAVDFMRHGDISVVAPFRYLVIVWAIIVGYIVWGEVPDLAMIVGTVIIIGTGIYTFHRERRLARVAAEPVDI
ncbi:MAG: DMT family transporter, partial [Bauldia sp.]|nr:DMT family transporter [Bauldia sp.]